MEKIADAIAALAASYLEQWAVQTFNIHFISGETLDRHSLFQMISIKPVVIVLKYTMEVLQGIFFD